MTRALLLCLLLALCGCTKAQTLDAAIRTSNAAAHSLTSTHEQLTAMRREAQLQAARAVDGDRSDPVVQVNQLEAAREAGLRYRPAWGAYSAARAAWLSVVGVVQVVQDGGTVSNAELARLLATLASARRDLEIAISWLRGEGPDNAPPPAPQERP